MKGSSFRGFIVSFSVALLVWFSAIEQCTGRRGEYWRQNRGMATSLFKKKGKSHSNSHKHHKSKAKSHKAPSHSPNPKLPLPPSPRHGPLAPVSKPPKQHTSPTPPATSHYIFNVLDFGAKGDGKSDDTKGFLDAWAEACKVEASTLLVPAQYEFYLGPISFSGPYCKPNIVFQLDGTIVAPTNADAWKGGSLQWLEFTKLKGITIQGKGTIEGRGSIWWEDYPFGDPGESITRFINPQNTTVLEQHPMPEKSELSIKLPTLKPTALRFYGSFNVTVSGITIQNSPQCHLKFDSCMGVVVHNISVNSPGDSPNTDGIHLQNSQNALIHSSSLSCGDDCVSIQTGCSNVYVHNVNCGPGHGISIGSLGRDNTKACVSNVTVRDVYLHNTMAGVRIKTWQGGAGSVQNIMFANVEVSEVQLPIVIDQYYCDKSTCKNQSSAVALSGINYERIRGTYTVKPMHFACSDYTPCIDVSLTSIELKPVQKQYHLYEPYCWQTFGEMKNPTIPPIECIQTGKPATSSRPLDVKDIC